MVTQHFSQKTRIECPAAMAFEWHCRPGAFVRLQPPWEKVELPEGHPGVSENSQVKVRANVGPFVSQWLVEHRDVIPGIQFRDVMLQGPFALWVHTHRFVPLGENACMLADEIDFRLPLGWFGKFVAGWFVHNKLSRMFRYRHAITKSDLEKIASRGLIHPRCILVSGASGLIGSALESFLQTQGHTVLRLVRRKAENADEIFWRPETGELDGASLGRIDAVVHLSGANVAGGRWTAIRRAAILDSRVQSTRILVNALRKLEHRPSVFVCASAVGYYGDRIGELSELEPAGHGFLAGVSDAWERESDQAQALGIRVVKLRIGVVLAAAGGALAKMLPVFRIGLGGRLGAGRQMMSWIALEDLLSVIEASIFDQQIAGPINAVSPHAVSNAGFTKAMGEVLNRPTVIPVPKFLLRLIFGQMADETLLANTHAVPAWLLGLKFRFRLSDIREALRETLGR